MSNFSVSDLHAQIMNVVEPRVIEMAQEYAETLKDYIKYEYMMSNIELASSWKMHGYDFKMMPESFIQHIEISPVSVDGNRYSLEVRVSAESFREESADKYEFFKKYVIGNAMNKIRAKIGAR